MKLKTSPQGLESKAVDGHAPHPELISNCRRALRLPSNKFQTYPVDIHACLAKHLDAESLLAISLTCRALATLYALPLSRCLALNSADELLNFVLHHQRKRDQLCAGGHSLVYRQDAAKWTNPAYDLKLDDPGTLLNSRRIMELHQLVREREHAPDFPAHEISSGLLGAVLDLCPKLKSIRTYHTTLPLTTSLAHALLRTTPNLTTLIYRSKWCDPNALALLLSRSQIKTLDVSSAHFCACKGDEVRHLDAEALGCWIVDSRSLQRLVLTSSYVTGWNHGALWRHMATQNYLNGSSGDRRALPPVLKSLELRRTQVNASAFGAFLSSPNAGALTHLFLGGVARLSSKSLEESLTPRSGEAPCAFVASCELLDLEIDARLMSSELLKLLGKRIGYLRVFEPSTVRCMDLTNVLANGFLPKLHRLVICPRSQHDDESLRTKATRGTAPHQPVSARHAATIALTAMSLGVKDATVGDDFWWGIEERKNSMAAYRKMEAEDQRKQAAESARKALQRARDADGWEADEEVMVFGSLPCGVARQQWGEGGLDHWRD
ncbi:hypothetical protein CBOM_05496 [Ceraceosorus bombacis]|uniref:F-box domain-containing protein n=1 Tax=Ceraceosorus bombacis TaxID=401625 RepID=A0A0N7LB98_9BASI|nr:hypothetical protein CBOM_05496 [Ceraceosorus bombacis]